MPVGLFLAAFARDYHAMGERKVEVSCNVSVDDTVGREERKRKDKRNSVVTRQFRPGCCYGRRNSRFKRGRGEVGERGARPGNQDLHFSREIGFAIKGFGIKFNSAGAPWHVGILI